MFLLLLCSRKLNCWVQFCKYVAGLSSHTPNSLSVFFFLKSFGDFLYSIWLGSVPFAGSGVAVHRDGWARCANGWDFLFFLSKDTWQLDFGGNRISSCKGKKLNHGNWLLKSSFFSAYWSQWLFPKLECYVFKHLLYSSVEWSNSPCLFPFIRIFSTAACIPNF